ncbi:Lrp/AsnC family transcriptional regulator [Saccharibacillus sacchari]|uniref:Lrp/AsnC family transcriptional regulator n=1 Tax=Saccharibacillus sacchari TaxID=456493 RepID=A0ACC6PGC1_9BACL
MDNVDKEILVQLQEDARLSMTELGKRVGLSQPAVTERVRRLEEQGVIEQYRTVLSGEKIGKPTTAFILFSTLQCTEFVEFCRQNPRVVECHRVTGEACYLIKIAVESNREIEIFENEAMPYGHFKTLISLSSPVLHKALVPAESRIRA